MYGETLMCGLSILSNEISEIRHEKREIMILRALLRLEKKKWIKKFLSLSGCWLVNWGEKLDETSHRLWHVTHQGPLIYFFIIILYFFLSLYIFFSSRLCLCPLEVLGRTRVPLFLFLSNGFWSVSQFRNEY